VVPSASAPLMSLVVWLLPASGSAGVLALSLIIALFMLRVRRQDLSGADPAPAPADGASSPGRA
jgi:hypothetical protein